MTERYRESCSSCGSEEIIRNGSCLAECRCCGLVYSLPNHHLGDCPYSAAYYGKGSSKFIPIIQKIRNRIMQARAESYLALIPKSVRKPRILDVGCAEGRLLKAFCEKGCECWGVEHSDYPDERFLLHDRIRYLKGDIGELDLPRGGFDLIFLWHVLEHLDEPDRAMKMVYEACSAEGIIILAVPNFASLESRRFKEKWFHLDLPFHKYHFTYKSLNYLVEKNRLKIIRMTCLSFEQGPYGLIQSILNEMGWQKNEVYEALKGNRIAGRSAHLLVQLGLVAFLAMPALLATLLTSSDCAGPVLEVALKRKDQHPFKPAASFSWEGKGSNRRETG